MLDKLERISYLYDIYGVLLTEKQQKAMQMYYFDNLSLGEIAFEYQISRQGVYDLLKRALDTLEELEKIMQLFQRYNYRKEKLDSALIILQKDNVASADLKKVRDLVEELQLENES